MATPTPNLKLLKPAEGELADVKVLNANFDKIDAALDSKAIRILGLGSDKVIAPSVNVLMTGWTPVSGDISPTDNPDSPSYGNGYFTTKVAGLYLITAIIRLPGGAGSRQVYISGDGFSSFVVDNTSTNTQNLQCTGVAYLAAGAQARCEVRQGDSSNITVVGNATSNKFAIARLA